MQQNVHTDLEPNSRWMPAGAWIKHPTTLTPFKHTQRSSHACEQRQAHPHTPRTHSSDHHLAASSSSARPALTPNSSCWLRSRWGVQVLPPLVLPGMLPLVVAASDCHMLAPPTVSAVLRSALTPT
jgi:hypothetical protein